MLSSVGVIQDMEMGVIMAMLRQDAPPTSIDREEAMQMVGGQRSETIFLLLMVNSESDDTSRGATMA